MCGVMIFETLAHLLHPRMSNNHRPRILHPEGFLLLFFIVVSATLGIHELLPGVFSLTNKGRVLGYSTTISQAKVVEQTNTQREKLGLPDLVPNQQLNEAALAKARDMFEHQYWAHYSPTGKSPWEFVKAAHYTYYVAGENLARDFLQTDDMVSAWMNSPTHRENIVNPKYHDIGVAVVNGKLNGVETTLVVQMFGQQLSGRTVATDTKLNQIELEQVPVPDVEGQEMSTKSVQSNTLQNSQGVLALSMQRLTLPVESHAISPLYLLKAVFLAVIMLVVSVLIYDHVIITNRNTVRFVGKNLAHIMLFLAVGFLVLFFKSGSIE